MAAMMIARAPLALLATSLATLAAALGFQHVGGLDPCVLCIYQRWPYLAVAGICGVALLVRRWTRPALFACTGAFVAGLGLAGFHVGVEQGWWAGTAACGAATGGAATVEELRAAIMSAPVARCDTVAWSLFGISMAGYNFLISAALAAASMLAGLRWQAREAAR